MELLYLAQRLGLSIEEMPVSWADQGESSVNLALDPLKMLYRSALVPLRHRRVK